MRDRLREEMTAYDEAQSWLLVENEDGSYSIQTPYESGRIITAQKGEQALLCSPGAEGEQKWIIGKTEDFRLH